MGRATAWQAAWAAVLAVLATAVFEVWSNDSTGGPPKWLMVPLGLVMVLGLALVFSPVFGYWPFRPRPAPENPSTRIASPVLSWRPGAYDAALRGSHRPCIAVYLDPPSKLRNRWVPWTQQHAKVEVRLQGTFKAWGPIEATAEDIRGFNVAFPDEFDPDLEWPPPQGRYTVMWILNGRTYTSDFIVGEYGKLQPMPVRWRTRSWARLVRRTRLIISGFNISAEE